MANMKRRERMHRKVLAELERLAGDGHRYEVIHTPGNNHQKIFVNGKLACIYPFTQACDGNVANIVTSIRRASRGIYAR